VLSPMPDYNRMTVDELKRRMGEYRMRTGGKAYMVERLTEIWREMHKPENRAYHEHYKKQKETSKEVRCGVVC